MSFFKLTLASLLLGAVRGQQIGTLTTETHPTLNTQKCVTGGTCTTQNSSITLDSNWRWTHATADSTNCYSGNTWDADLCPDGVTCAANCAIDGADYEGTYGITASDTSLEIKFVTDGAYSTNIGSRVYLMADEDNYQMFNLKNQEFTFDVDVSNLSCGLNGALYFVAMSQDGGLSEYSGNKAGAMYGTGYCDSQCPRDMKFINGEANSGNWTASATDSNAGTGTYGSCCDEMDIWEANSISTAFTPHPCNSTGQTRCEGSDCGDDDRYGGLCDKDGCDFNSYRLGNTTFFGANKTVDSSSVFTVVTQFITNDGTANGTLSEIRRIYVQNGVVIQNSAVDVANVDPVNSITDDFCTAVKTEFGDENSFATAGGLTKMGAALEDMVLVMSLWDDHDAKMLWLDSDYPADRNATTPGVSRGTCVSTSGVPTDVESDNADASVIFSNIKFGDLNSTYTA